MLDVKILATVIVAGISAAGFVSGIGAFVQSVRAQGRRIGLLEDVVGDLPEDVAKMLYNNDNQPIYTPAQRCETLRISCQNSFERRADKIDEKLERLIEILMDKR